VFECDSEAEEEEEEEEELSDSVTNIIRKLESTFRALSKFVTLHTQLLCSLPVN
jgi:hypothetical protein